jgi:hypothetical protein
MASLSRTTSPSDVLRGATARVLPILICIPLVARLVDAPPRSVDALASFASQAWIAVLLRPLVVAVGLSAALYVARARVGRAGVHSRQRAVLAVLVVLAVQLVGSMGMQAAGPVLGVPIDLASGVVAALLSYTTRVETADRRAAT